MLLMQVKGMDLFRQVKQWEITIPVMLLFICLFIVVLVAIILRERVNCSQKEAKQKLGKATRHPALTQEDEDMIAMMDLERPVKKTPVVIMEQLPEGTYKHTYDINKSPIMSEGDYIIGKDADLKAIANVEQTEPIVEALNKEEAVLTESEKQLIAEYKKSMEDTDFIITDKEE